MKYLLITLMILCLSSAAYSQFPARFSLAGGPMVGFYRPDMADLNNEMRSIGLPEFETTGYVTFGGGGFIDVPGTEWLRVGGLGLGFSTEKTAVANNLTKTVVYDLGMGGASFEYVGTMGKSFEFTGGVLLSIGELTLQLYQNDAQFGNWSTIWGEIGNGSSSQNISRTLTQRFYGVQPRAGLGMNITNYLYGKLNVGYMFSANSGWKADNNIEVYNPPKGIKPDGLDINLSFNFGLFFK